MDDEPLEVEDEKTMQDFHNKSKKRWEATKACIFTLVFFTFLLLFTCLVLFEIDRFERYFQADLTSHFHDAIGSPIKPKDIKTQEDFWLYFEKGLMPALYGNNTVRAPGSGIPKLPALGGDELVHNRILGAIQIRQMKVQDMNANECGGMGAYALQFSYCFPAFSEQTEDRANYGSSTRLFSYQTDLSTWYRGKFAWYGPGGYLESLTANETAADETVKFLKGEKWLDIKSRAIFFEFNVWNPNIGVYATTRLIFELSPVGVWNFDTEILILKPSNLAFIGTESNTEWMMTIGNMCLGLFLLFYLAEEVSEISVGVGAYISDGWNLVDLTSLALLLTFFILLAQNIVGGGSLSPIGMEEKDDASLYTNLMEYSERAQFIRQIQAFNAMLIWAKTVKYIPMMPYAVVLKQLLSSAGSFFISYFCVFFTFFFGFALSYTVGFGSTFEELGDWLSAMFYLGRSLLGDVDATQIYRDSPMVGSILIALFVLGVYLVMLNVFYALMLYAFSQTREALLESKDDDEDDAALLAVFWQEMKESIRETINWERTMKKCCPGLHARTMVKWRRSQAKVEKRRVKRLENHLERTRAGETDRIKSGYSLMQFNKSNDQKDKGNSAAVDAGMSSAAGVGIGPDGRPIQPIDDSDDDKSMDLGPLSPIKLKKEAAWRKKMGREDDHITVGLGKLKDAVGSLGTQLQERVNHIGGEVRQEMRETKEVMTGLRDVMNVVNTRVAALERLQQENI